MNYYKLSVNKKFPRYNCHEFEDDSDCSWKFRIAYEDTDYNTKPHNYNIKPNFNPLEKAIFDTRQGPFDIYDLSYVLCICRGFLISNKLKKILLDYNICNHVIFDKIKYRFKDVLKDDMNFIYFYQDFSDNIDFRKSLFSAFSKDHKIINGKIKVELIEESVPINSYEDYKTKAEYYSIERKLSLREQIICCPIAMEYDIFTMMKGPVSRSVFISERLKKRLKKEEIKGIEYGNNMHFKFGCIG